MSCSKYRRLSHRQSTNQVATKALVKPYLAGIPKSWWAKKRTRGRIKEVCRLLREVRDPSLRFALRVTLGLR